MKNCVIYILTFIIIISSTFSLVGCSGMSVSDKYYNEISNYLSENIDSISHNDNIEFFDYKTTGLSIGGVYYGYYYTADNKISVPDFYSGGNLGKEYEEDGGTYFGKPNDGTDWCFIKKITENWFYYELHWA